MSSKQPRRRPKKICKRFIYLFVYFFSSFKKKISFFLFFVFGNMENINEISLQFSFFFFKVSTKPQIQEMRKTFWFEKFLWFISSDNYLIICGKDMQQNEMLFRRYLKAGSQFVLPIISCQKCHQILISALKKQLDSNRRHLCSCRFTWCQQHNNKKSIWRRLGKKNIILLFDTWHLILILFLFFLFFMIFFLFFCLEIPPTTLEQAGIMSVCRSVAWNEKVVTSAWWVHHDQVTKN